MESNSGAVSGTIVSPSSRMARLDVGFASPLARPMRDGSVYCSSNPAATRNPTFLSPDSGEDQKRCVGQRPWGRCSSYRPV